MPKRTDLRTILLVGAARTSSGYGCELDFAGAEAAHALREEGYGVVTVSASPSAAMTDPDLAMRAYVEPIERGSLVAILERERPDAIVAAFGGEAAVSLVAHLHDEGVLARHGVELLGAPRAPAGRIADDARLSAALRDFGAPSPRAAVVRAADEAPRAAAAVGLPAIVRPSCPLDEPRARAASTEAELARCVEWALAQSGTGEARVEESVAGLRGFDLAVMRDARGGFVVVCWLEQVDPLGVRAADAVLFAPATSLGEEERSIMRRAARAAVAAIGLDGGAAHVRFAVGPEGRRVHLVDASAGVSRATATAAKATGYPIATVAAKLAVGYALDEISVDAARTSAALEPAVDRVTVRWPRFAFDRFPDAEATLGAASACFGEAIGVGGTLAEALQKAARALDTGHDGLTTLLDAAEQRRVAERRRGRRGARSLDPSIAAPIAEGAAAARARAAAATPERLFHVADAMRLGASDAELAADTGVAPDVLAAIRRIVAAEERCAARGAASPDELVELKALGFSDRQIASLAERREDDVRRARHEAGIRPACTRIAGSRAVYATYAVTRPESAPSARRIAILGGGPYRVGCGAELDDGRAHVARALEHAGVDVILIDANPEAASTHRGAAGRVCVAPLTVEDVAAVCEAESVDGVITQLGGANALALSAPLARVGVRVLGTSAEAIEAAADRATFDAVAARLSLARPRGATARSDRELRAAAEALRFPLLVRGGATLGAGAVAVARAKDELDACAPRAFAAARRAGDGGVFVEELVAGAVEVDVDCICDGARAIIAGVVQHVEEAGVHSGDSSCVLPPYALDAELVVAIEERTRALALALRVVGFLSARFAVRRGDVFLLGAKPRAGRGVAFVSRATGRPLAAIAASVMLGHTLDELGLDDAPMPRHVAVKVGVFPFARLAGVDPILGPSMRAAGEVMGIADTFARALAKCFRANGVLMAAPRARRVALLAVADDDKPAACVLARRLRALSFDVSATRGIGAALAQARVPARVVGTVADGAQHVVDAAREGALALLVNTASTADEEREGHAFRRRAFLAGASVFTTMAGALAACAALESIRYEAAPTVAALDEWTYDAASRASAHAPASPPPSRGKGAAAGGAAPAAIPERSASDGSMQFRP